MSKFKIGDKVKVVKEVYVEGLGWTGAMSSVIGKVFKVVDVYNSLDSSKSGVYLEDVDFSCISDYVFPDASLELTGAEPKPKFKVGDMVVIARDMPNTDIVYWASSMSELVGKTFRIEYISDTGSCKLEGGVSASGYQWNYPLAALEHAYNKFIDGVAVSQDEFDRRTAAPVEMSLQEIEAKLGFPIKLK